MASLIPALSDKAKQELKVIAYNKKQSLNVQLSMNDGIEAFQDLFDLEKYPITWEMLFEYSKKARLIIRQRENERDFIIPRAEKDGGDVPIWQHDGIRKAIHLISIHKWIDRIIIIGDIHGWWEKPQTY
jgi:hypothetical protein